MQVRHSHHMLWNFQQLLNEQQSCLDFSIPIQCADGMTKSCNLVLGALSPIIKSHLMTSQGIGQEPAIILPDISTDNVNLFLDYLLNINSSTYDISDWGVISSVMDLLHVSKDFGLEPGAKFEAPPPANRLYAQSMPYLDDTGGNFETELNNSDAENEEEEEASEEEEEEEENFVRNEVGNGHLKCLYCENR